MKVEHSNRESVARTNLAFLDNLSKVVGITQDAGAKIVVVGGIALRAILNKPVESRRPNGTTPDIDIIGLGPTPDILLATNKEIAQYQLQNPNCPEVGLEPAVFSDTKAKVISTKRNQNTTS